jgi:hypothetical protein
MISNSTLKEDQMLKISEAVEEEAMILMTSKDKNKPEKC